MSTSVVVGFGSPIDVVYFTEEVPGSDDLMLAAAVVWRGTPPPPPRGLRGLVRKLRYRLGPLGLGLHFRWSEPWGGAATGAGEQLTLYRSKQRVVRVLGRNYAVPRDGRTLVLLIDQGAGGRPAVTSRALTVAAQARSRVEEAPPPGLWHSILRSDPQVGAFMAE